MTEVESMSSWMAGLESGIYEGRPPGKAIAAGQTRRLSFGSEPDVERIVAVERPFLFAYAITSGMPIESHLALMTLTPIEGGTRFAWHQCFASGFLLGVVRHRCLRGFVRAGLETLSTRVGGGVPEIC